MDSARKKLQRHHLDAKLTSFDFREIFLFSIEEGFISCIISWIFSCVIGAKEKAIPFPRFWQACSTEAILNGVQFSYSVQCTSEQPFSQTNKMQFSLDGDLAVLKLWIWKNIYLYKISFAAIGYVTYVSNSKLQNWINLLWPTWARATASWRTCTARAWWRTASKPCCQSGSTT